MFRFLPGFPEGPDLFLMSLKFSLQTETFLLNFLDRFKSFFLFLQVVAERFRQIGHGGGEIPFLREFRIKFRAVVCVGFSIRIALFFEKPERRLEGSLLEPQRLYHFTEGAITSGFLLGLLRGFSGGVGVM